MKTKLRLFCIFLCLTVVNNVFANILNYYDGHITLVGEYNGHKVYVVNEGADKFFSIGSDNIYINRVFTIIALNGYALTHLKVGINTIESSNKTEKEYLIYEGNIHFSEGLFFSLTNNDYFIGIGNTDVAYWEKSKDNGITWERIECTDFTYAASETEECTVMYRNVSSTGDYSEIITVKYIDPVPEAVKTNVDNATKTVDEATTFTLDVPDHNYTYQWLHDGKEISGATANTYHIDEIKAKDAGSYTCRVSNECSETVSAAVTLTVNKCPQVIDFPEFEVVTYGCDPISLPLTTNKGLTITYQSTNQSVATVSGNVVTVTGPGEANIIASQAGTDDYLAATAITRTLHVNKITQSITFNELPEKTYGDIPFNLPETSSEGLTISYKVINTEVATVDGNTVTIVGAGTTEIIASQEGDEHHSAAAPVTRTLTVNKARQTITFNQIDNQQYGNPPIKLNKVTDKGLPITYTVADKSIATVTEYSINLLKPGTTTITATQAGNKNYLPADSVTRTLTIGKGSQVIVWGEIPNKEFNSADFDLPLNTDKGLPITYKSDNEAIATVNGNTVHITGVGQCNITATQEGNDYYNAAAAVTLPFTVTKSYQTITFEPLEKCIYGTDDVLLEASTTSGVEIYFESSDENVARIDGNKAVITGAGTCYITAKAVSTPNWYDATPVQRELIVEKADQTVDFDDLADKTYGDEPFALTAEASSGQEVTFTSSDPQILFIDGTTAKILGAGDVVITATQAGGDDYQPMSSTKNLHINKANLQAKADDVERIYGDKNPKLTITYTGFVNGDTEYDLDEQPKASTNANESTPVGTYDIGITPIEDKNYSINFQRGALTIEKAPLTIKVNDTEKTYGEANPKFTFEYEGLKLNETAQKALNPLPTATTTAKTGSDAGTYPIEVTGANAVNYEIAYKQGTLTIEKAELDIWLENETVEYGDEPEFKLHYDGWKLDDDEDDLDILPNVVTQADVTSYPGSYDISLEGGLDNNYRYNLPDYTRYLNIEKATLQVTADDVTRYYGQPNPEFTLTYEGFKNNETEDDLERRPTAVCNADENTWYGEYPIMLSGGYDSRYTFDLHDGVLTILPEGTSITETEVDGINIKCENGVIIINPDESVNTIEIYDITGQLIASEKDVNGNELRFNVNSKNVYIVKCRTSNGTRVYKILAK